MKNRRKSRAGNATVEFVMTGIPLIFIVIGVVEMSRGIWIYESLVHAVESTTRDMAVRGYDCSKYVSGCGQTVAGYSQLMNKWATGIDPAQMTVVFQSTNNTVTCSPLNSCYTNSTAWPPSGDNARNLDIWVTATMPFNSALSMFAFGSAPVNFGKFNLSAKSHQQILF
jgi:Flp pilus assembly protein TadG